MIDATREVHLAIIRKHVPETSLAGMTLDAGGEHHVYVVDGSVLFRFPQIPRTIPNVRVHAIKWLAANGAIPFQLPTVEIQHDREFDIWFERARYLPGTPFISEVAATFSHDEQLTIARQMGDFLSVLHALPLPPARASGMDEMDPTDFWEYMRNNPNAYPWVRRVLWPVLPRTERSWIEHLFESFIEQTRRTPLPLVIRHGDMSPYHIIVDPDSHDLVGVIDFSWRIADPAGDFKTFEYYGQDFVEEAYAHYRGSVDPGFDRRRLFYTGHDQVFRLVRALEANDVADIAGARASLSTYIAAHPRTAPGHATAL